MINKRLLYGWGSFILLSLTSSNIGSDSFFYLTHATLRKSILLLTNFLKIYKDDKDLFFLYMIFTIFFLLTFSDLTFNSFSSFYYANLFSMILYIYLLDYGFLSEKAFRDSTILLNQIVFILFWTLDFPSKNNSLKNKLIKKNKDIKDYLNILQSLNSHGFMNLFIMSKIANKGIGIEGLLYSLIFYFSLLLITIFTYYSTWSVCNKKSLQINEELSKKNPNYYKIKLLLVQLQKKYSKSIFFDISDSRYETITNNFLKENKKYQKIFKLMIPYYEPSKKELDNFKDKNFLNDLLYTSGYIAYDFLRIKKGKNFKDMLKNPKLYIAGVFLPVLYGINNGVYKLLNRKKK